MASSPGDELLTVAQIADELQVTRATVRRWINEEKLVGRAVTRRSGFRVRRSDLNQLIKLREGEQTVSAPVAQPTIGVADRVIVPR